MIAGGGATNHHPSDSTQVQRGKKYGVISDRNRDESTFGFDKDQLGNHSEKKVIMVEETRSRHIPLPCSKSPTTSKTRSVRTTSWNGTDDMIMDDDGRIFPNMVAVAQEDWTQAATTTTTTKPESEKDQRWHPGYYLRKMVISGKFASSSSTSSSSLSSVEEPSPVQKTVAAITEEDADKERTIPTIATETTGDDANTDHSSSTKRSQIEDELQTQIEKLQQLQNATLSKFHEDDNYSLVFERCDSIISSSSEEDSSWSSYTEESDDDEGGEDRSAASSTVSSLSLVSYSLSDDNYDNNDDKAGGGEDEEIFLEDSQKKNYHVMFQKNNQNSKQQTKMSSSSMPICRTDRDHPTTSSTVLQSSSFLSVVKQAFGVGVATRNYDKNASKRQRVLLAKLVSQDLCNRPATLTTEVVIPPPPQQSSSPLSSRLSPNILLEKVSSQQPSSPGGGTASTASSSRSSTGSDGSTGRGEGTSSTVYDVTNNHTLLPQRVTQDSLLTKHALLALHGKTNMSRNKASGDLQEPKKTIKQKVQQSVKDQLEIPDLFVPDQTKCQSLKPTASTSKQNHHEKQLKNIRLPSRSSRNDVAIEAFYVRPV